MARRKPLKATTKAVDEAMDAEGLTQSKDLAKVAAGLRAVLNALPPAPSSPLDAGVRRRMGEAAEGLDAGHTAVGRPNSPST
jgi:hypothetical protein